jgi:Flp pilus assembly protein TadD
MTDELRRAEPKDYNVFADDFPEATPAGDSAEDDPIFADSEAVQARQPARTSRISGRENRLRTLDRAIAEFPDAPTNYVLRGELLMKMGDADLAAADFLHAMTLAATQLETANWGFVLQALHDRAQMGYERAQKRLG